MAAMPFLCRDPFFHENYHIIEMKAYSYILQFSIFLFFKKQICFCINGPGYCHHCLLFSDDLVLKYETLVIIYIAKPMLSLLVISDILFFCFSDVFYLLLSNDFKSFFLQYNYGTNFIFNNNYFFC